MVLEGAGRELQPLRHEIGGHRYQRVPPNERNGRVHTSTVTVAVLDGQPDHASEVLWSDVEMRFTKATGAGGQHRNKRDSCVVLTHRPTGITSMCDGRDQHANRRSAWRALQERVAAARTSQAAAVIGQLRRRMVGSGQRGDKVRTYRYQDGRVTDHRKNRSARLADVFAGNLELFW